MKCFVLSCCLVVLVAAVSALPSSQEWHQYKREHGKVYSSRAEEGMRRANFERSKAMIAQLNDQHRGQTQFKLNHLSDISEKEYGKMNGLRVPENWESKKAKMQMMNLQQLMVDYEGEIPKNMDWRQVPDRVSEVKNQGQCGSCWSFSTTGVLEGQEKTEKISKLISLSEQQLMDCSQQDYGCNGGLPAYALEDIATIGGIMSEKDYPYDHGREHLVCHFNKTKAVFSDVGPLMLESGDDEALMAAVAKHGPVSVGIDATTVLQHYAGGVLDDPTCSDQASKLNHAVLLVGYGTDEKEGDYWLVKNSWGAKWGEKGYFRLSRQTPNKCGISLMGVLVNF